MPAARAAARNPRKNSLPARAANSPEGLGLINPVDSVPPISPVALFGHIANLVSSSDDLDALLAATVNLVRDVMRVERCSILLPEDEADAESDLTMAAAHGIPADIVDKVRVHPGEGIAGGVFADGHSRLGNAEGDERYTMPSFIACPIHHEGETIGVMNVTNRVDREPFTSADVELIESVAAVVGIGISRSRLVQRLRETNGLLARLIDGLPIGLIHCDRGDSILHFNRRACELLTAEHLSHGTALGEALSPALAEVIERIETKARTTGRTASADWNPARAPGEQAGSPLRVTAHHDPGQDELLIIVEDLTLTQTVEELRRLDEMKNNFISLVSHELRTPITSLRGASALLSTFYAQGLDETQQNLVRIVVTSSERLSGLVNMIIDVAMLDQERLELHPERGHLDQLVRDLFKARAADMNAKSLTLRDEIDADLGELTFDSERLGQAIGAVIDNAIKYGRHNSEILARLWKDGDSRIRLRIRNEGDPITRENREKLFDRFTQVEGTMTRRRGGTGLGLYLARKILMLHGGVLEILDDDGGACLEFVLPMATKTAGA